MSLCQFHDNIAHCDKSFGNYHNNKKPDASHNVNYFQSTDKNRAQIGAKCIIGNVFVSYIVLFCYFQSLTTTSHHSQSLNSKEEYEDLAINIHMGLIRDAGE